jgi:hypothetical protein
MTIKQAEPLHTRRRLDSDPDEGWTWLRFGRRAHYFRDNKSLCGKFSLTGAPKYSAEYYGPGQDWCLDCKHRSTLCAHCGRGVGGGHAVCCPLSI